MIPALLRLIYEMQLPADTQKAVSAYRQRGVKQFT